MALPPLVLEQSIEIAASTRDLWRLITDWENLHLWMKEGRDFKVTSGHREGVGVQAVATIRIGFLTTTDPVVVTRWEPQSCLALEHLGWVKGLGEMFLTRQGSSSTLFWRETLTAPLGVAGWIGIRIWGPVMQRIFKRDLRLLKELAERGRGLESPQ